MSSNLTAFKMCIYLGASKAGPFFGHLKHHFSKIPIKYLFGFNSLPGFNSTKEIYCILK